MKDESRRFGLNSFKGLGASYAIYHSLRTRPDIETFCTATDGNHGRAVAWSANKNGKKSVIFVPSSTTTNRIGEIEKAGATVIQIKGNYDAACLEAKAQALAKGWMLIQDTAWADYIEVPALIVSGYTTMFKELDDSLLRRSSPKIDIVFLQAGVGSMAAAGIFFYLKRYADKKPKIVIVEPRQADGVLYSFQNGKRSSSIGTSKTIMAGLNCETPSLGAWEILKNGVDYTISISDDYTRRAMRELYYPSGDDMRIISGESGAAGFAGFLSIINEKEFQEIQKELALDKNTHVLFINTEGDTDKEVFRTIVQDRTKMI